MIDQRVRKLNKEQVKSGPIVYWMSRDQRMNHNWALLYAQMIAKKQKQPLVVVFALADKFLQATIRQYGFMIRGLLQLQTDFNTKNIEMFILKGEPQIEVVKFIKKNKIGALITDFDPLKIKIKWRNFVKNKINCAFFEVDAHNIIPCWQASNKQEYAAYTFRPKVEKLLDKYLTSFPILKKQNYKFNKKAKLNNFNDLIKNLEIDFDVSEIDWLKPGEKNAKKQLKNFINKKLHNYEQDRNDPNLDAQSNLSPYLHFGQICSQTIVLEINKVKGSFKSKKAFLEELIVRKELSDNFCFYNKNYDNYKSFPKWAMKTLNNHNDDKREYIYSKKQLEQTQTHDELWNAAQNQMIQIGKMHGYMRMYWAKKILQWTKDYKQAQRIAIYLNDKYELDGRDPNGYTGIAWSIGGVHDRAWPKRPVFGKVRYMSYNGAKSKFDVKNYAENNQLTTINTQ